MTNLYIVDDHSVVIEGILSLLKNSPEIVVVGFANTATVCLNFIKSNNVDVILMDINLPDINGVELCKQIKTEQPDIKILALSMVLFRLW